MRKIWDIHGGVHPPENKTQSTQTHIAAIPLPSEIILPLNQHIGAPSLPACEVGQNVLKGELIADAQGFISAPVHASTSGTVTAIEDRFIPHSSGMKALCIVIKPDGEDRWAPLTPYNDYTQLDKHALTSLIRNAGITGLGGAGFPTSVKLQPKANQPIDTLILNGTECEPYITADDVLMRERAAEIIEGTKLLAFILGNPKTILIGIEDNKPEAINAMQSALADANTQVETHIEIVSFPTKYPSGGEKQLVQILTGKEVISGKLPADIGIVVQNVGTALAAYRAVKFGEPLVSRVTTVVGEALGTQQNIDVLIGTPIQHILEAHGYQQKNSARLILGGPMMGFAMEHTDIPVIKTTNCVLAPSHTEMTAPPPAQACIRCGMCEQACPANLLPQQLFWFSQSEDFEKLDSHNLFDCIECGACSYVCPSSIPLVQYYRASKGTIRQINADKQKSDRARERFEARQERIEKAEAEKEAKRAARKVAAEQAKLKLAEAAKNGSATSSANEASAKPADAAKANTPASTTDVAVQKIEDPAVQLAKLERALSSTESRLVRAKTALEDAKTADEPADEKRLGVLEARIKEANQKVSDAKDKRDAHSNKASAAATTSAQAVMEKLAVSPQDKLQKSLETIEKRIATAKEKLAEAIAEQKPTADALRQGVAKLEEKRNTAQAELNELMATSQSPNSGSETNASAVEPATLSAAESAIAKAQAKAEAAANMTPEQKQQAQREALKGRLEKAHERLRKAEEENSEHVDAFRAAAEKLEAKLAEGVN